MDAVLEFKMLVVQSLYNLSDEQMEYQVRDRLSFVRFSGLGSRTQCPMRQACDCSAIGWRRQA